VIITYQKIQPFSIKGIDKTLTMTKKDVVFEASLATIME